MRPNKSFHSNNSNISANHNPHGRYDELPQDIRRALKETSNFHYKEGDASIVTKGPLRYSADAHLRASNSDSSSSSLLPLSRSKRNNKNTKQTKMQNNSMKSSGSNVSIQSSYTTLSNVICSSNSTGTNTNINTSDTKSSADFDMSREETVRSNGLHRFLNRTKRRALVQKRSHDDENQDPSLPSWTPHQKDKYSVNKSSSASSSSSSSFAIPSSMRQSNNEMIQTFISTIANEQHQILTKGAYSTIQLLHARTNGSKSMVLEQAKQELESFLILHKLSIPQESIEASLRAAMLVLQTVQSTTPTSSSHSSSNSSLTNTKEPNATNANTNKSIIVNQNQNQNQINTIPWRQWKQLVSESIFCIIGNHKSFQKFQSHFHQDWFLSLNGIQSLTSSSSSNSTTMKRAVSTYTAMVCAAMDTIWIVCYMALLDSSLSSCSNVNSFKIDETRNQSITVSTAHLTSTKSKHEPTTLRKNGSFFSNLRKSNRKKSFTLDGVVPAPVSSFQTKQQTSPGSKFLDRKTNEHKNMTSFHPPDQLSTTASDKENPCLGPQKLVKAVDTSSKEAMHIPRAQVHRLGTNFISKVAGDEVEIILLNPQRSRHNR